MRFEDIIKENKFNFNSSFEDVSQKIAECYYLRPYPKAENKFPHEVNRYYHGALHACSTTRNLEMEIAFINKHFPKLLIPPDGTSFDTETVKLLKFAAFYHDAVNTSEVYFNEYLQAENFEYDMCLPEFKLTKDGIIKVRAIAYAMANKNEKQTQFNLYHALIHDADALEILRIIPREYFIIEELELFKYCIKGESLEELNDILDNHKETYQIILKQKPLTPLSSTKISLHLLCENYSENCFDSFIKIQKKLAHDHIVEECLKKGVIVSTNKIPNLDILDLYNRKKSKKIQNIIDYFTTQEQKNQFIEIDFKEPYCVRRLEKIDIEFEQLYKNDSILNDLKITNVQEFKNYINLHSNACPRGFKWRPSSLIIPGIPIDTLERNWVGVLIDPKSKTVIAPYSYKSDIGSDGIANNPNFDYNRKKNKGSIEALKSKIIEQNQRRKGKQSDLGLHYFGQPDLENNEILCTYLPKDIKGIVVPNAGKEIALDALLLRARFHEALPRFYRYDKHIGLTLVSEEEIIKQSCILETKLSETINKDIVKKSVTNNTVFFENNFYVNEIKQISRVTREKSNQNLLRFQFAHPKKNDVTCIARMKKDNPVIEFYKDNEKTPYTNFFSNKLPAIAIKYYADILNKLNVFLEQGTISSTLEKIGILDLRFSVQDVKNFQDYYVVSATFKIGIQEQADVILKNFVNLFKIQKYKKVIEESQLRQVFFPLPTNLELYSKFLLDYHEFMQASCSQPINFNNTVSIVPEFKLDSTLSPKTNNLGFSFGGGS